MAAWHPSPGAAQCVPLGATGVGLVLGAGAVRGLAELGVYKAMVELGVPIDWVGGSSIGSIVGAAVAHDWEPEHAISLAREAFVKGKPFSDYTLPVISLIRGKRMMRLSQAGIPTLLLVGNHDMSPASGRA